MKLEDRQYRALISSDWNECLAPSGPFDAVAFTYPSLAREVRQIFKAYTGGTILLSEATKRIAALLPASITEEQMDAYLDQCFRTYRGVPELIEWCSNNDILFMINTTGMKGYFQRVFKKGLLPDVPVVSSHPLVSYREGEKTDCKWYDLLETRDKSKNTLTVMRDKGILPEKLVLIGDSGGDGPHFEWGNEIGAFLIGCMTKPSLEKYCGLRRIKINFYFGPRYSEGEVRIDDRERDVNFMELIPELDLFLSRKRSCETS